MQHPTMAAQKSVSRFSSLPIMKAEQRAPSTSQNPTLFGKEISISLKSAAAAAAAESTCNFKQATRKLPILLFDVMDTLIRDPFYHDIPTFFRMSMKELMAIKHPTAWIEFEKGQITEMELARNFFADGRPLYLEGLKSCMRQGFSYIEGVEKLLADLKKNGYEMHTATNYPIWYQIIEEKLKLSTYLSWTFCSCNMGKRKPDPEFFADMSKHLNVEPKCCAFIDDRMRNVDAAREAGFIGIHFRDADSLQEELSRVGVVLTPSDHSSTTRNF